MFVGHAALAFAVRSRRPDLPLGLLIAAVFGLDLLWPIALLLGVERAAISPGDTAFTPIAFTHYPWTHSLVMAAIWGLLLTAILQVRGRPRRAALIVGALVLSHWLLDFVVHRPDLPIWPGLDMNPVGLGLWQSIPATLAVEGGLFVVGVTMYMRRSRAADSIGLHALLALLLMLTAIWLMGVFGPPPGDERALAWSALVLWILPVWAEWMDRHRRTANSDLRTES